VGRKIRPGGSEKVWGQNPPGRGGVKKDMSYRKTKQKAGEGLGMGKRTGLGPGEEEGEM